MAYIKHCPWNWTDLSHSPVRWRRANRRQRPPPTSEKASISSGIRLTWGHRRRRRCEDTDGTPVCDWLKRSVSPSDVSAGEGRTFFWDNCARHCWDTATGSTHFLQSTTETYMSINQSHQGHLLSGDLQSDQLYVFMLSVFQFLSITNQLPVHQHVRDIAVKLRVELLYRYDTYYEIHIRSFYFERNYFVF